METQTLEREHLGANTLCQDFGPFGLLFIYYCTRQMIPKLSGLKQHPFMISVSVGQESMHGLGRYICLKVSHEAAKCGPELWSHLKVQLRSRRTHFQVHSLTCSLSGFSPLWSLRVSMLCWLLAGGLPQFISIWTSAQGH